jgi:methylmalonyl-CoA/ethylmalonyl-CoA epimerase
MNSFGLSRIGQIAVPVKDIARAVAFYRDQIGMKFLFQAGKLAFFDCSGIILMLDVPEDAEFQHPSSVIYFTVDDIQAGYAALKSRGVRFRGEPHIIHKAAEFDLWMAFFYDSEENTMAIRCEQRRP